MAHGGRGRGGGGEQSAIADHVGLFTAIALLGGYVMAIVMVVKHPRIGFEALLAALAFTVVIGSDPMQHPLLGLAGIIVGFCLVKE
jgi:hypothetical protein